MKLPLFWIDAFTDRPFGGNPAAVVPLDAWPDDALMQRMAFEHGLSETAFLVRTGGARFHLRWFTPRIEIDLCGHATLASAHALFAELGQDGDGVIFDTRSGSLGVTRRADGKLEMDFPSRPAAPAAPPEALGRGLGRTPESTARSERMWLCLYPTADDVRALRPDHAALAAVTPGRIIVTAPGRDCDFVSRFFAPEAGITEDPVTGSAHCTLMPYWAARLGRTALHARQVSARGGELWCELAGDRVRMQGRAVTYLRGAVSC
ncbi:MAG: PhzF family phenazine biosynthesis protein [Verrucomicrobia bacterium]|nr:PhzF family phenazine biosynthesis protein [Verrucomicrobiota bacterium]